jgi:hypothetical protein
LHNQSALRLKGRLLFTPGVMVTSVPWQLTSSAHREDDIGVSAEGPRGGHPGATGDVVSHTGWFGQVVDPRRAGRGRAAEGKRRGR